MITDMKNRIRELMEKKGMSQKIFAQELKLGEATVSGIFNGRTNPSMATVQAIHNRFPEVNVQWLMFGDGEMILNGGFLFWTVLTWTVDVCGRRQIPSEI